MDTNKTAANATRHTKPVDREEGIPFGEHIYKPREVAKFMAISLATLYRLVELRKLGHLRVGTLIRFRKAHIEEYLSDNMVEPWTA